MVEVVDDVGGIINTRSAGANMLRPIREAAGLGCPPSPYYMNV